VRSDHYVAWVHECRATATPPHFLPLQRTVHKICVVTAARSYPRSGTAWNGGPSGTWDTTRTCWYRDSVLRQIPLASTPARPHLGACADSDNILSIRLRQAPSDETGCEPRSIRGPFLS